MKNHEKLLIIVGVLLVVGIGISFAYFSTKVNSSGIGASTTATTVTKGDTNITTEGVIEFNDLNIYPGHSNISKIKGVISPAYANLRYKNGFSPNFYNYYFKIQYWTFAFFIYG